MDSPYQSVSSIVDEKAVSIQHLELPHDQDSPKAATLETQQNNNIDDELEIRKQFKDLLAVPRFMEMRRIHRRLLCLVDCIMIMILACYLDEPEEQWYNDTFLVIGALLVYVATTWESFALIKPNYWKGAANIGLMDDRSTLKENFRKDFYFGKINMVWDPEERRLGVVEMRIPFLIRYIADPDAYLGNPFHMFSPYYAVEIGATIHLAKIALMFFCYQLQTSYGPVAWNFLVCGVIMLIGRFYENVIFEGIGFVSGYGEFARAIRRECWVKSVEADCEKGEYVRAPKSIWQSGWSS